MSLPSLHPLALAVAQAEPTEGGQLLEVVALAVVQGLTEFLPVSSSGHLVLGRALLGVDTIDGALITIGLHVGTLLAVLAVYWRDLLAVLRDAAGGRPRDLAMIVVGSVPAAVVGIGGGDRLDVLFESPNVAAVGLLGTALILVTGDVFRRRRELAGEPDDEPGLGIGLGPALFIGAFQALAILPGISRSGATICAGLVVGLAATRAARFSFLLSLVAVGGAALLDVGEVEALDSASLTALLTGIVVSAVVGLAALRLLLVALRRGSFPWFAAYCTVVAAAWFASR